MKAYYATKLSDNMSETPEGYLICKNVPICRTGWQDYRAVELGLGAAEGYRPEDIVKVYRDEAEVLSPATMASFEGKTVTSPHPPLFLNTTNDAEYNRGSIHNVRKGPVVGDVKTLIADIFIKAGRLAQEVKNNILREVSCGYDCLYEPIGDRQYEQKNIRGNHLAIIPAGRCGPACQIMDCACHTDSGKEEQMEGQQTFWKDLKDNVAGAGDFFKSLGWKQPTADSDPGAVERNAQAAAEALERARRRNMDEEQVKKEATDKRLASTLDAMDAFLKKQTARDEAEKEKEAKDAEEEKKKAEDKKAKDEEEKKKKESEDELPPKKKGEEESEDADLIPVETLAANEIPKNPIPGADKALDALRALRPMVARGTKDEKVAFNSAIDFLKGRKPGTSDAYAHLTNPKKPEGVETTDADRVKEGQDFASQAKQFHRKNPQDAKAEIARKENK